MPPKKKPSAANLIGSPIVMESKYDDKKLTGTLVSLDNDYLGVEVNGRVFYFSKYDIRCFTKEINEQG